MADTAHGHAAGAHDTIANEGHGDEIGHGAGHGDEHASEALGPIDWRAWLAGVVGAAAGLLVALALALRPAS
jgi:hypothetical protein